MWGFRRKRRKSVKHTVAAKAHYLAHKEASRELVLSRLSHFNQHYNLSWKRVAIRNQRRCWGSCSSLKNLNFNYKILLLPPHLMDYIVVHELCHLVHLNHGRDFWTLVAEQIPEYQKNLMELRAIDKGGHTVSHLLRVQKYYLENQSLE